MADYLKAEEIFDYYFVGLFDTIKKDAYRVPNMSPVRFNNSLEFGDIVLTIEKDRICIDEILMKEKNFSNTNTYKTNSIKISSNPIMVEMRKMEEVSFFKFSKLLPREKYKNIVNEIEFFNEKFFFECATTDIDKSLCVQSNKYLSIDRNAIISGKKTIGLYFDEYNNFIKQSNLKNFNNLNRDKEKLYDSPLFDKILINNETDKEGNGYTYIYRIHSCTDGAVTNGEGYVVRELFYVVDVLIYYKNVDRESFVSFMPSCQKNLHYFNVLINKGVLKECHIDKNVYANKIQALKDIYTFAKEEINRK